MYSRVYARTAPAPAPAPPLRTGSAHTDRTPPPPLPPLPLLPQHQQPASAACSAQAQPPAGGCTPAAHTPTPVSARSPVSAGTAAVPAPALVPAPGIDQGMDAEDRYCCSAGGARRCCCSSRPQRACLVQLGRTRLRAVAAVVEDQTAVSHTPRPPPRLRPPQRQRWASAGSCSPQGVTLRSCLPRPHISHRPPWS